jgi:GTP-binding protein
MNSSALPSVVIVGRPNVGKSSLFNCLTKTRQALVADQPGLTRDRLYGRGVIGTQPYIIIDTSGLTIGKKAGLDALMELQTQRAISDADIVLFLADGRAGLTALDELLAKKLRQLNKRIILLINKGESLDPLLLQNEFASLGFAIPCVISTAHEQGLEALMDKILTYFPKPQALLAQNHNEQERHEIPRIKIAIIGKPNVGKSTLLNRILGEERVVVFDQPGTTRDSTAHDFSYRGKEYTLIDTAGIRRKSKTEEGVEKFSIIKSLQAIESSHVVLLLIDATAGITDQDLHLLGFILEIGKALVIAVNKWDGLSVEQRTQVKQALDRRLQFVNFAKIIFISALHGTGVGNLFSLIQQAYRSATHVLSTSHLTRLLEQAVSVHQPPLRLGRTIKLRYAHPGGYNPPIILIHGQHTRYLPESYRRYLENFYRKSLRIVGSPIRIEFRDKHTPES